MSTREYAWEATQLDEIEETFRGFPIPEFDGDERQRPTVARLREYPQELVDDLLGNERAHPLITMAHLDQRGYPFISVMGFSYLDGRIAVAARANARKQRRLEADPRCSFCYHNMIPRPDRMGFITLVGKAEVTRDPELLAAHARAVQFKNYREGDPDIERRDPAIASMIAAERELILLDEVEAVYFMVPMEHGFGSGRPTPLFFWRGER